VHTYDWTVPDDPDPFVWIRVRMDNSWDVGAADFFTVIARWGPCS
jgi:hypothetical protein